MAEGTGNTATFLMTDIEGSTRLWETIPERMTDLLMRHDGIVATAVVGNGGSLIKARGEGDSHFAVFRRSADAVAAAVALQRRLDEDETLATVPIRVRVGVHAGEATFRDMDYYGPTVNRCARIRGVGAGGQILVSEAATTLAREGLAPGVDFRELGHHRLRDLLRPECLFQVVAPGLRTEFPALASLNASNIPVQPTSFVGRRRELDEVRARLRGTRLLTLLGTGGVGKTRLAYQAAAEAAAAYPDGVVAAELAEVATAEAVPEALATALGLSGDPFEGLRGRSLLVVLDNCEHVIDGVRALVRRVLRECPTVAVLATSRQTLRLAGETSYDVHPLALPPPEPDSVEALLEAEAGRLFVERAEAISPRFAPVPGNLRAISRVCVRLEGLPLAIELAAARANVLSPAQIDERLAKRLQFLGGGRGSDEGRHRTMRETVAWSYRMLSPAERGLMGRLTAFRGGWTLDAIETALEGRWDHDDDPLDVMQDLVGRSWRRSARRPSATGSWRRSATSRWRRRRPRSWGGRARVSSPGPRGSPPRRGTSSTARTKRFGSSEPTRSGKTCAWPPCTAQSAPSYGSGR